MGRSLLREPRLLNRRRGLRAKCEGAGSLAALAGRRRLWQERPARCGTLFALWLRRSAAAARSCMSGARGAQFAPRAAFTEPAHGAAREMRRRGFSRRAGGSSRLWQERPERCGTLLLFLSLCDARRAVLADFERYGARAGKMLVRALPARRFEQQLAHRRQHARVGHNQRVLAAIEYRFERI